MIKQLPGGVQISLHVLPNAPKSQIIGEHNGSLKIKIKAPPVDGKANEAIVEFFSRLLKVSKSSIEILKGDKSKAKKILIHGLTVEVVQSHLQQKNN